MTGPELQQARDKLGASREEFAKAFGVHKRTVYTWEGSPHDCRIVPVPRAVAILTKLALKNGSIRRELGLNKARIAGNRRRQANAPPKGPEGGSVLDP